MSILDSEAARKRLAALSQLEQRLSFRIARMSKLLDGHATRQLAGTELNLTAYRILMVLSIFEETSAADLARLMVIDRAQISRSASEMIAQGLLIERPDPGSKRRKLLRLSDAGQAMLDSVTPIFEAREEIFSDLMTAEEREALIGIIDRISRRFAQELDQLDAVPTLAAKG